MAICCVVSRSCVLTYDSVRSARKTSFRSEAGWRLSIVRKDELYWEPVHEWPSAALSVGLAFSLTTQYAPRARPPSDLKPVGGCQSSERMSYTGSLSMNGHLLRCQSVLRAHVRLSTLRAQDLP